MKKLIVVNGLLLALLILVNPVQNYRMTETPVSHVVVVRSPVVFEYTIAVVEKDVETSRGTTRLEVERVNEDDITVVSGISSVQLGVAIEGTALEGLGIEYVLAEEKYGINAVYLMAITILESGWGTSPLAVKKNNISGFTAYDDSPYESATHFDSKGESIQVTARVLSEEYVTEGLRSIDEVGSRYAKDPEWADKVKSISKTILRRINGGL